MKKLLYISSAVLISGALSAAPCGLNAVRTTLKSWEGDITSLNPSTIASSQYMENATLMGTVASESTSTLQGRTNYFKNFVGTNKAMGVEWNSMNIVDYSGSSVASGVYTFSLTNASNQTNKMAARYTFTLENTPTGCKIVSHHSSAMPVNAFNPTVSAGATTDVNGASGTVGTTNGTNGVATQQPAPATNGNVAPSANGVQNGQPVQNGQQNGFATQQPQTQPVVPANNAPAPVAPVNGRTAPAGR
ncbi:MAG: nuclear transport factor 2 family protein [Alphaproteobacteria bacterium]|jgi:hypothetical protein|nr:nuclear transport factor 2 family protein [Alphaproteobacteria bacterium]